MWTPIAEAVLGPALGDLTPEFESIPGTDNPPNSNGSSFGGGWYGYVYKDLRTLFGDPVEQPYRLLEYTMRWTNRSTFQQVIEFTGHATP